MVMPSRQYFYQLRKRLEGKCLTCGQPRDPASTLFCASHLAKARVRNRESARKAIHAVKRNYGALSYREFDVTTLDSRS